MVLDNFTYNETIQGCYTTYNCIYRNVCAIKNQLPLALQELRVAEEALERACNFLDYYEEFAMLIVNRACDVAEDGFTYDNPRQRLAYAKFVVIHNEDYEFYDEQIVFYTRQVEYHTGQVQIKQQLVDIFKQRLRQERELVNQRFEDPKWVCPYCQREPTYFMLAKPYFVEYDPAQDLFPN